MRDSPAVKRTRVETMALARIEKLHFGKPVAVEYRLDYDTKRVQQFVNNYVFDARAYREIPGMRSKLMAQLGAALIERARAENPDFDVLDVVDEVVGGENG